MRFLNLAVTCMAGVILISNSPLDGKDIITGTRQTAPAWVAGTGGPDHSIMNLSNIHLWVRRDGYSPYSVSPFGLAGAYPPGVDAIFAEGIVWGAKVNDGSSTRIRVNGSTYASGLKAGKVLYDGGGNVAGSEDPTTRHVWRVRPDYRTADLTEDAASFFGIDPIDVTSGDIDAVYAQYDYDWLNWPADEGAPFYDAGSDGVYDPDVDIPGESGAAQTIWLVANDLPSYWDAVGNYIPDPTAPGAPAVAETNQVSWISYGSPPIGIEMQLTLWTPAPASGEINANCLFKRVQLVYTGLPGTSPGATLDTLYISQWSDPDLGNYTDDFVGWHPGLQLGYAYNSNPYDQLAAEAGYPPPAIGYMQVDGPLTTSGTTDASSFVYFGVGISDPDLGEYVGSLQFFNLMEGFLPRPAYPTQSDWNDPTTGIATKFTLNGDPVMGIGWIDGIQLPPGDRRMVISYGPYAMSLGDSLELIIATVGGLGLDNLESVVQLWRQAGLVRQNYGLGWLLAKLNVETDFSPADATDILVKALMGNPVSTLTALLTDQLGGQVVGTQLFDDGLHNDGAAGDLLFGQTLTVTPTAAPLIASLEIVGTSQTDTLVGLVSITTDGPLSVQGLAVGDDFLNGDGAINPGEIVHLSLSLLNEGEYTHTGLAANVFFMGPVETSSENRQFFLTAEPGVLVGGVYDINNTGTYSEVMISDTARAGDSLTTHILLADDSGNIWKDARSFPIQPFDNFLGELGDVLHSAGTADASVSVKVTDVSAVTGDEYEVYFHQQEYYRDVDGEWKPLNQEGVMDHLDKASDISLSTVTGAALASATAGTIDLAFILDLRSTDGNWIDGFLVDLPDNLAINYATASGAFCSYQVYGQLCENLPDGLINEANNTVFWGDSSRSSFGAIEGDITFTVNVDLFDLPITSTFHAYDDNYSGNITDAIGTVTFTELAYELKTEDYWNLRNVTAGTTLLENMAELGTFNNGSETEGFVLRIDGTYEVPLDYSAYQVSGAGYYDIESYMANNWAATARASDLDCWGCGTDNLDLLERDIQLRFTGEYAEPETTITGVDTLIYHPIEEGTGSMATFVGARLYDLVDHPLNPSPETEAPFTVRIPLEVWDLDADGGPEQIDIIIYDRRQEPDASGNFVGDFYAFNPYDRMYCHILHRPYNESVADVGEEGGAICGTEGHLLTWNLVFWQTEWQTSDAVTIHYDNPIRPGVDLFTFTTAGLGTDHATALPESYSLHQNYPNPFNPITHITYSLPRESRVKLTIYDLLGREVIKLVDATQGAGRYSIPWQGRNRAGVPVASGIYFYRIETRDPGQGTNYAFHDTRKMLLLK